MKTEKKTKKMNAPLIIMVEKRTLLKSFPGPIEIKHKHYFVVLAVATGDHCCFFNLSSA